MKKILALAMMFAASSAFAQSGSAGSGAGGTTYTAGNGVVTAVTTGNQTITVQNGANVTFTQFTMTLSKAVSMGATEDQAGNQLLVAAKHFNSDKIYGGRTGGGSITECATKAPSKNSDLAAVPAIDTTTGACP